MNVIFITAINVGEDIIKFYASFGQTVSCKSDINLPTHVLSRPFLCWRPFLHSQDDS